MINTVYGDEVATLMNSGWTLDIENSMLHAPQVLEPAAGFTEAGEIATGVAGIAEAEGGFEAADLPILSLFF